MGSLPRWLILCRLDGVTVVAQKNPAHQGGISESSCESVQFNGASPLHID